MPAISQNIINNSASTTADAPSITKDAMLNALNAKTTISDNKLFEGREESETILSKMSKPPYGKYVLPGVVIVVTILIVFFIYKKMK